MKSAMNRSITKYPSVIIAVINYNGGKHIIKCIQSLLQTDYVNYKIVILDNASIDSSVNTIRDKFPHIEVIRLKSNIGYAGGANYVLDLFQEEYIVILNNDIYVEPDWLRKLVDTAENNTKAIMIGPRVRHSTASFAGARITFPLIASRIIDIDEQSYNANVPVESSYVSGAAFLIRRNEALSIGNFDSDYFLNWEEIDFAWRAWLCGYRVLMNLDACVIHDNGRAIKTFTLRKMSYFSNRNRIMTYCKYLSNYPLVIGVIGEVIYGSMILLRSLKIDPIVHCLLQGYLLAILWIIKNLKFVLRKRLLMQRICKYWGLLPPHTIATKVRFGEISQYVYK